MDKITELKAKAYDVLAQMDQLQRELQKLNLELVKAHEELKTPPKDLESDVTI